MKATKLFLTGLLFFSFNVPASNGAKYLKKGDENFNNKAYFIAIDYYKKAISGIPNKATKAEILFKTAECYRLINDPKQAEVYYGKCIKLNYPDPFIWLWSAESRMKMGMYADAMEHYKKFKDLVPSHPGGELGMKSCLLAAAWIAEPTLHKVENLLQINTRGWDYSPAYDGKKYTSIYFSTTREGVYGSDETDFNVGERYADIFYTSIDKLGKWNTPQALPEPLNSSVNEAASVITRKGNTMYFTRCGVEKDAHQKCQLYFSTKRGNTWDPPVKLPFNLDTMNFGHPALSADEETLYFSSDMSGGYGGLDLWRSRYDKKSKSWGEPENLGPNVNTNGDEMFPFIHENGTLYFSSNGHPGMGGLDMYRSRQEKDLKWGSPENLKYPMNSSGDDFGIIMEGKAERGYFTSNRSGGKGGDDIYSFYVPPIACLLKGHVYEKENFSKGIKVPIADALVKLLNANGQPVEIRTDNTGFYSFGLETENSYLVQSKGEDVPPSSGKYLGNDKGKVSTIGIRVSTTFEKDLFFIKVETSNRLPGILYDTDRSTLDHASNPKDSLEYLYKVLMENPKIVIELASHTDYRDSHSHNDTLSYYRAKSCVDFLISKGVHPARMMAKGYGERKPLKLRDDVTLPSGKKLNAGTALNEVFIKKFKKDSPDWTYLNQLNRRTEFSVIRDDFTGQGLKEDSDVEIKMLLEDNNDQK